MYVRKRGGISDDKESREEEGNKEQETILGIESIVCTVHKYIYKNDSV